MSIETGRSLSHFKNASIEKGKSVLVFSRRAAIPIGAVGALTGAILAGMHGQADNEFSPRVKIEIAAILLSLAIFSAPSVGKKMVDKLKRHKDNANPIESPESTEEP